MFHFQAEQWGFLHSSIFLQVDSRLPQLFLFILSGFHYCHHSSLSHFPHRSWWMKRVFFFFFFIEHVKEWSRPSLGGGHRKCYFFIESEEQFLIITHWIEQGINGSFHMFGAWNLSHSWNIQQASTWSSNPKCHSGIQKSLNIPSRHIAVGNL